MVGNLVKNADIISILTTNEPKEDTSDENANQTLKKLVKILEQAYKKEKLQKKIIESLERDIEELKSVLSPEQLKEIEKKLQSNKKEVFSSTNDEQKDTFYRDFRKE